MRKIILLTLLLYISGCSITGYTIKEPKLEVIDDASDALALAIIGAQNLKFIK